MQIVKHVLSRRMFAKSSPFFLWVKDKRVGGISRVFYGFRLIFSIFSFLSLFFLLTVKILISCSKKFTHPLVSSSYTFVKSTRFTVQIFSCP